MEHKRAVWVAEVADRGALVRLIRAALARGVTLVDLDEAPVAGGSHILQIRYCGEAVVVLAAEVAGETKKAPYALRLAPLDPSHEPELFAIADGGSERPPSIGPMSTSVSAIFDSQPPLEEAADDGDELEASVLFDPEAAMISRAPPRPKGTGPEDSLTIPVRASMMPDSPVMRPERPPVRTSSGPHTISHLSFPSWMGAPAERQGSVADAPVSITVDFETSQGDPSTQPTADEHPDDREEYSIVIGNEPTSPESGRERAVGVMSNEPSAHDFNQDFTLTPTAPMDVPARRGPSSFRRDPEQPISEDAEMFPDDSARPASSGSAESSGGRGPRTMKRVGNHGIVVVGRVIANRYRIESLLGAGAIGAVYKASHVELPRTFAIKVLHPHFRSDTHLMTSFRTEARAASLLDHPNVTVVHDFGEEPDGLVYIVMEYLAGGNLQVVLDKERRLTPRRAIQIMLQVCAALSAAHERGIVHRDVKPDNIMLVPSRDDEGRSYELVKVCDFGIAALETAPGAADDEWTAGTPEYMAPEQATGRADQRTDVYACGIVLYEMLTGRPPFIGDSAVATLAKHATEQARRPSDLTPGLSAELEAVILRAIQKAPERRFATMRELRVELKRLLG